MMQSADAARSSLSPVREMLTPWQRLGMRGMVAVTTLQAIAGVAFARVGVRFDGALDVHRTWRGQPVSFGTAILDQLTVLVSTTLAATLVIRLTGLRSHLLRLLLILGTARVPLLLVAGVVIASPTPAEILAPGSSALAAPPPGVIAGGLLSVLAFAWFVWLCASGLRVETGARGWRLAGITAAVLIIAEIVSKAVLAVMQ